AHPSHELVTFKQSGRSCQISGSPLFGNHLAEIFHLGIDLRFEVDDMVLLRGIVGGQDVERLNVSGNGALAFEIWPEKTLLPADSKRSRPAVHVIDVSQGGFERTSHLLTMGNPGSIF